MMMMMTMTTTIILPHIPFHRWHQYFTPPCPQKFQNDEPPCSQNPLLLTPTPISYGFPFMLQPLWKFSAFFPLQKHSAHYVCHQSH